MNRLLLLSLILLHSSFALAATNTWTGDLDLGPAGTLVGDANDLFRVAGSFNNQTTNTAYNIQASTFEFTGTGAHNLEQFSIDRGPCQSSLSNNFGFGTLRTAGTVTIVDNFANSAGNDAVYVQTITGTGTLVVGAGTRVYFGTTNGWSGTVNLSSGTFRPLVPDNVDADGDGILNGQECACGTDPANATSALRITNIRRIASDVEVTWTTVGGFGYILQTNSPTGTGGYTNNFTDFSPLITVPGSGDGVTNHLHTGGINSRPTLYYRVRLAP